MPENENSEEGEEEEEEEEEEEPSQEEKDEEEIEVELPQVWKLFRMSCSHTGECDKVGEEMDFQDTYIFREDKTVQKMRIRENETIKVEGIFEVTKSSYDTPEYTLNYDGEPTPEDIEIFSSCVNREEYLIVTQEDKDLLKNTVEDCDGPVLLYSRQYE